MLYAGEQMIQIAWAADGFPMYEFHGYRDAADATSGMKELHSSWRLKSGERPGGDKGPGGAFDGTYTQDYEFVKGSGDLDECNGRFGVTPEFPAGTYYYVITGEFPYVTRALRGTPDKSFTKNEGGRPGGPRDRERCVRSLRTTWETRGPYMNNCRDSTPLWVNTFPHARMPYFCASFAHISIYIRLRLVAHSYVIRCPSRTRHILGRIPPDSALPSFPLSQYVTKWHIRNHPPSSQPEAVARATHAGWRRSRPSRDGRCVRRSSSG